MPIVTPGLAFSGRRSPTLHPEGASVIITSANSLTCNGHRSGKKASKISLLFDPSMNHTCAYSDIQRQVKETINARRWLLNFKILMVEFIQIKCYMYKIQVAGEENQYLLSKHNANDGTSYSLNVFSMPDTVLVFQIYHLVHTQPVNQLLLLS